MSKKLKLMLLMVFVSFNVAAKSTDLPVKLAREGNRFQITNVGKCPIYKLHIYTAPPADSGLKRLWNMVAAVSFKKDIGTLKINTYTMMNLSELINSDGKRLDSSYVIGRWYVNGSSCGERLSYVVNN